MGRERHTCRVELHEKKASWHTDLYQASDICHRHGIFIYLHQSDLVIFQPCEIHLNAHPNPFHIALLYREITLLRKILMRHDPSSFPKGMLWIAGNISLPAGLHQLVDLKSHSFLSGAGKGRLDKLYDINSVLRYGDRCFHDTTREDQSSQEPFVLLQSARSVFGSVRKSNHDKKSGGTDPLQKD